MIELTDTHCHIQSIGASDGEENTIKLWQKAEDINVELVIKNAQEDGVNRLICVGCNTSDSKLAIKLVKDRHNTYASIGIHPHEAKRYISNQALLDEFADLVSQPKVVAIGECGLDYFYNHSSVEDQKAILRFQIELAVRHNLPLIFHVREAFSDFWPIINEYPDVRGVLHSFTDSLANMRLAADKGFYIGVNGIATFAKSDGLLSTYKAIPDNYLLLETDSPYLTPTPYRGNINEPRRVRVIAEFLAKLKNQSLENLALNTTHNAIKLFGLN